MRKARRRDRAGLEETGETVAAEKVPRIDPPASGVLSCRTILRRKSEWIVLLFERLVKYSRFDRFDFP